MQFDFSSRFILHDGSRAGIDEVWPDLCLDLLRAEFGYEHLLRLDAATTGVDILDRSTKTAFRCLAVSDPEREELTADEAQAALALAREQRDTWGWERYVFATNKTYSGEAMAAIRGLGGTPSESDVEFVDAATWSALCSKHEQIARSRFDYGVSVSPAAVAQAFKDARYFEHKVSEYEAKIARAAFAVRLSNNRTPVKLDLPFSPELTVSHLIDVGMQLFGVELDTTYFADLGTSARLTVSIVKDERTQTLNKSLADIGVDAGGELQLWLRIIWQTESPSKGRDDAALRAMLKRGRDNPVIGLLPLKETDFVFRYFRAADVATAVKPPSNPEEATIARKLSLVTSAIWQKAGAFAASGERVFRGALERSSRPVRLGASAPEAVAPGSSFRATFMAYHPDLEREILGQLREIAPSAKHQLDRARAAWKLGTRVIVRVHGDDLTCDPDVDEFVWGGEKHMLDFRISIPDQAIGKRDLKFDVYVDDCRIARLWIEISVRSEPTDKRRDVSASAPSTAFASYASGDRPRVLDRVASLEIRTGMQIFLDCVSLRPNAKWRELLNDLIQSSDQLLLFWSKGARDSEYVSKEWRHALKTKGIAGIEVHPLDTYDEVPLPPELADIIHGSDPLMVLRAHEVRVRAAREARGATRSPE